LDHPASTFDSLRNSAIGQRLRRKSRPCGFTALYGPCATRAASAVTPHMRFHRVPTVHTGSTGSFAAVSLSRDVPLPAIEPWHDRAEPFCFLIRRRSWDSCALRSFPCSRVPGLSTVHPHIPLSNSSRAADFYGCRSQIKSFQANFLERPTAE